MSRRPLAVAGGLLAACAVLAVASPAQAAPKPSKAERVQNAAIKKTAVASKKTAKSLTATRKTVTKLGAQVRLGAKRTTGVSARVKAIEDQVPLVTNALQSLSTAATQLKGGIDQLAAGLTALKGGVDQIVVNLTNLGTAYQSVEYGAVKVFRTRGATPPSAASPALVSSDIPDDGNPATVFGQIPIPLLAGDKLTVSGAIRSAEADGVAGGAPAGQFGVALIAVLQPTVGTAPTGANSGLACATQTPAADFQTPAGTKSLTLKNIPLKSARTDSDSPSDAAGAASANSVDSGTVGATGVCTAPFDGTYLVSVNAQFTDIPTSATPAPGD